MSGLWINTGELSGDVQGGAMLAALRRVEQERGLAPLSVAGMGGDNLAAAGQENVLRVEELSVMGGVEVLTVLPRALRMLARIRNELIARRPDAVLLIDAPEFNFRVARLAHTLHIPVYYFIPPKVWAWRTGRVRFLQRYTKRLFSILPFEVDFYRRHGMDVTYVGNPLVDLVNWPSLANIAPVNGRIGLMPGSRRKEVESLLPAFAGAADRLIEEFPHLTFHAVRAPHFSEAYLRRFWPAKTPLHVESPANRYAFLRTCQCLMAASGTATLESGLAGVPTLVAYKLNPLSYLLGTKVVRVPYISLTNLILGREAFPEHIQDLAEPEPLARRLRQWLTDPEHFARMKADMEELRRLCGEPGSAERAARALLTAMGRLKA